MPEIRPIRKTDVPSFSATLDRVAREKRYIAFIEGPPIEATTEFVSSNIEAGIPHYVAINDDQVVGWCDIGRETSRQIFQHIGHLGMGIIPEFRGQGLGRGLITAALEHGKRIGILRFELTVFTSNEAAIGLYKSVGFEIEGTKRRHARFEDRYEDSYIMACVLEG